MKRLFFLLSFLCSFIFVFEAYACPDLPYQSGNKYYKSEDDTGDSGTYASGGYTCSKYIYQYVSGTWRHYYRNCSCDSYVSYGPYTNNPNGPDGPATMPPCNSVEIRSCYDVGGEKVYYEVRDCNSDVYAYGDMSKAVGDCLYSPDGGTSYTPDELRDANFDGDSGWEWPDVPVEPSPWYQTTPEGNRPWQNPSDVNDLDGDGITDAYDNDLDGDGIGNSVDTDNDNDGILDNNDLTPYDPIYNPHWRDHTTFYNNGPGPGVEPDGGIIETKDGQYIEWGDTSGVPLGWVDIGGNRYKSPEDQSHGLSGGGGGGGPSASPSSSPPPVPVSPEPSADPENIPVGEDNTGNTSDFESLQDIVTNTKDNLAGQKVMADLLAGIEEKTGIYGAANNKELQRIGDLIEKLPDFSNNSDRNLSHRGKYFKHIYTYYEDGIPVGWKLVFSDRPEMALGAHDSVIIGKGTSSAVNTTAGNNWHPSNTLYDLVNPWTGAGFDGGTGSGSGVTGDDVLQALAGDRAIGDAAAETERLSQEAALDAAGEPDYTPYDESDVPDYSQDQTDYETEIDNLSNNSAISAVRDSLGVTTSGSTPSLSCQLCGQTITFDFSPHASILQSIGNMWISLCYLSGFLLIMRG